MQIQCTTSLIIDDWLNNLDQLRTSELMKKRLEASTAVNSK